MKKFLRGFLADASGATAIEYGAIVMFIGLALVLVLEGIGLGMEAAFNQLKAVFSSATVAVN
jgi:Flp pilus assembly pilin Flp